MGTSIPKSRNNSDQKDITRNDQKVSREALETAYCFFHQKQRVFQYSTMEWQKVDIEYAINSYLDDMNRELYLYLSDGREEFLRNHDTFGEELLEAVERLESVLGV